MKRLIVLVAGLFAFLSLACQRPTTTPPVQAESQPPVIVTLVGRNQTLTVTKGPHGPLYSIRNADGHFVCEPSTREQIAARDPDLARFIDSALASSADAVERPGLNSAR